jgi:hypothetical protein
MSNNKQSMKLYTEEQVREMIVLSKYVRNITNEELLSDFTPIELPSDEEIEKDVMTNFYPLSGVVGIDHRNYLRKEGFQEGIKYLRNKIGGNNEQN